MSKLKTVLFLSDRNHYLQHELYCQLSSNLPKDLKSVFLASDFKGERVFKVNMDVDQRELNKAFSKLIEIPSPNLDKRPLSNPIFKSIRIIQNLRRKQNWRESLLRKVDEIRPNLIVITSTNAENTRVISRYRQMIPKLYIQPSNIRISYKGQYTVIEHLKHFFFNQILRLPILPVKETTFDHYGALDLALWSDLWKSHAPIRKESIFHFTGNPVYDQYFSQFSLKLSHSAKPKVWIYLNKEKNIGLENWNIYTDFYRQMMRIHPDFDFVFKAHPLSQLDNVQRAFPGANVTHESPRKEKVDIMITHWSTMALEFIAAGIPVILVNPEERFDFSKRYLSHYGLIAKSQEDIICFFEKYRKEGNVAFLECRQDFIRKSLISDDGKSTERVIELIEQLSEPT